jgi:hypothetical protein
MIIYYKDLPSTRRIDGTNSFKEAWRYNQSAKFFACARSKDARLRTVVIKEGINLGVNLEALHHTLNRLMPFMPIQATIYGNAVFSHF